MSPIFCRFFTTFSVIICISLPLKVFSQQYYGSNELDSLIKGCDNYNKLDINKANYYNQISRELSWYYPEKGIDYALKAEALSKNISYSKGLQWAILNKAINQIKHARIMGTLLQQNSEECANLLNNFKDALLKFQSMGYIEGQIQAHIDIAFYYNKTENWEQAEIHADKAMKMSDEHNMQMLKAHAHLELVHVKILTHDTNTAKEFYNYAIKIYTKLGATKELIRCYHRIAGLYESIYKYHVTNKFNLKAIDVSRNTGFYFDYAQALSQTALSLDDINQTNKSIDFAEKSLEISQKYKLNYLQAKTNQLLGVIYSQLSNYKRSTEYCRTSLNCIKGKIQPLHERCYLLMAANYKRLGDYKLAHLAIDSAIVISRLLKDNDRIASGLSVKGDIYYQQNEFNKAKAHLLEAMKYAEIDPKKSKNLDRIYIMMSAICVAHGELDSAANFAEKALKIAKEISDEETVSYVHIALAKIERTRGAYQKSYGYLMKALQRAKIVGNPNGIAFVYYELSDLFSRQTDRIRSILYLDSCIHIAYEIGNLKMITRALNSKGKIYSDMGDYSKAIAVVQESMIIAEKLSPGEIVASKNALAKLYLNMKDYSRAAVIFSEVASEMNKAGNISQSGISYLEAADAYMRHGDFKKSEEQLESANDVIVKKKEPVDLYFLFHKYAQLRLKQGDIQNAEIYAEKAFLIGNSGAEKITNSEFCITLAEIKMAQKNYSSALIEIQKAIELSSGSQKINNLIEALKLESDLFKLSGKFDSAYASYVRYIKLRDSIFNIETRNEITRKELQFEFDKKEGEYKLNQNLTENELKSRSQELELSRREIMLNRVKLELNFRDLDLKNLEFLRVQAELRNQKISGENRKIENDIKATRIALLGRQKELQTSNLIVKTTERNVFLSVSLLLIAISFFVSRNYINQRRSNKAIAAKNSVLTQTLDNLKKMQKQLIEVEQQKNLAIEKSRIARDMHDELGSGLTKISILSGLLKANPSKNEKQLDEIAGIAGELVDNMSQIIWTMNPENDKLENLFGYIRKYSLDFFENSPVRCTINIPEQAISEPLGHSVRRNIFLVIKETLNNVLKHSEATEVMINFIQTEGEITIQVKDDGKGFPIAKARTMGNGLNSMYRRMDEIGCNIEIQSEPGHGSLTIVKLPLGEYAESNRDQTSIGDKYLHT